MRVRFIVLGLVASSLLGVFACSSSSTAVDPEKPAPDGGTDTGMAAGACPASDPATWLAKPGTEHDQDVEKDETWRAEDSPHRLPRGLSVSGATLTIEPCAIVVVGDALPIHVGAPTPAPAKGDLVAVGAADRPILFRGEGGAPGAWDGIAFFGVLGKSRLSYVTIENAGGAESSGGVELHAALWLAEGSVVVDHSTLRGGAMHGIRIDEGASFGPASEGNTITGMAGVPIRADFAAVGSILDGKYTGNKIDRVELHSSGGPTQAATWHKLSVPWHFRTTQIDVETVITVEPGTHVIVQQNPNKAAFEGTLRFSKGGAIVADGGSAAGKIVFEGEPNDPPGSWQGFEFLKDAGKSRFDFVEIAKAGRQFDTTSDGHCEDPAVDAIWSAVKLAAKGLVSITNTVIRDVGTKAYAIDRDYCGGDANEFGGQGNTFTGAMLCGETDTFPCNPPACDQDKTCCNHDYACSVHPTP